jgi:adenylate cyclase
MPTQSARRISPSYKEPTNLLGEFLLAKFKGMFHRLRIPIFVKLAALSTLLLFLVISTTSFSMLKKEKKQFTRQLVDLGESMARITAGNASDKLLGEEDLALFQLVNDMAENDQVIYALITNEKNIIRAHSNIEKVNKAYSAPANMIFLKKGSDVKVSSFVYGGEEILFFEKSVMYQKLEVGKVRLAISQRKILESIRLAKLFILVLTVIIILIGLLLSLGLSMYISHPINKLRESTKALGKGDFDHRIAIPRNDELGDLGSAFNKMAEDLALKDKIQDSFGRYVTPEIVDLIMADPDDNPWMKGSRVEATVLFVDIRGFTTLSENKAPEVIVELLNDYFSRITEIVIKHGGHLNKFVGDAAMAIFGTPVPNLEHAEAAVKAALDIQAAIAMLDGTKLDGTQKIQFLPYQVGVGINSGEVVAGNLGSQKRMEYTVIGDNVNVASRLTSLAEAGEILISKRTYELIKSKIKLKIEEKGTVPVKGRRMEITIFNVLGLDEDQYENLEQVAVRT